MCSSKWFPLSAALLLMATLLIGGVPAQSQSLFRYMDELSQTTSPDDSWFKEVELADVNLDGWPDIVLPQKQPCEEPDCKVPSFMPGPNIDHLYLNEEEIILALDSPSAAFVFRPTVSVFPTTINTTRNYDVELGDLDLDGRLDIVRPDRDGELKVLWGNLDALTGVEFFSFTDVLQGSFGGNPNANVGCFVDGNYDDVDLADLDGDGDLDLVVAQWDDCGQNFLVENRTKIISGGTILNGTPRTFQVRGVAPAQLPAKVTHSVSVGDANQDGAADVLLANQFATDQPQLYLGSGQPLDFLTIPIELTEPGALGLSHTTVADLYDLNGDGRLDVYIAQGAFSPPDPLPTSPRHGVYFHSGNNANPYPTFTPWPETAPFSQGLYDARYGDLDGDGTVEVVVVNFTITEGQQRIEEPDNESRSSGNQSRRIDALTTSLDLLLAIQGTLAGTAITLRSAALVP